MYIESVANRNSPPCILLRESYRQGGKVRKRTLANLSHWPKHVIEGLQGLLEGRSLSAVPAQAGISASPPEAGPGEGSHVAGEFQIVRSLPHGHVAAVLGMLRKLGLDKIIAPRTCRQRDLVVALIVARIIDPRSKLATARGIGQETAFTSLGEILGIDQADENDFYAAMDWLMPRQEAIEDTLARRHLRDGMLVLYDLPACALHADRTSTYFEGRCCPLARYGHSRDGKKDKLQIVFGLLCDVEGRPIAVEVFDGNIADPSTLAGQIKKIRGRFGIQRVVLVGDRGLITEARIAQDLAPVEGLDWITALRAPAIRALVEEGSLVCSLFDQRDLGEIRSSQYPGERLVVCRNPLLAEQRRQKRQELLAATERQLDKTVAAVRRAIRPLRGAGHVGLRVGKALGRFKMSKHFRIEISEDSLKYRRDEQRIAQEAALDGIYVVRTSLPAEELDAEGTVRAYKGLSQVERAFRSFKTVDLKVRPIHHHLADRVRAHVLLCMLAYYVEWHMRRALAPLLFDDHDKPAAQALRTSTVAQARRSPAAQAKAATKCTADGTPVHSFQTLLADLATITKNRIQPACAPACPPTGAGRGHLSACVRAQADADRPNFPAAVAFDKTALPTPLQQQALDLLGVRL